MKLKCHEAEDEDGDKEELEEETLGSEPIV